MTGLAQSWRPGSRKTLYDSLEMIGLPLPEYMGFFKFKWTCMLKL
jgi:hypothetical protein